VIIGYQRYFKDCAAQHRLHLTAFGAGTRRPFGRKSGFQSQLSCYNRRQVSQFVGQNYHKIAILPNMTRYGGVKTMNEKKLTL